VRVACWTLLACAVGLCGCASAPPACGDVCSTDLPRELTKVNMPAYVIEPPDILLIDALRAIPKPPYHIEPLDSLLLQVPKALVNEPIAGVYPVEIDGTVTLGFSYKSVKVAGLTIPEAKAAIEAHLKNFLKEPETVVSLGQSRGVQQIRGPHLVRPDGTIGLGLYGGVRVAGLTLTQAKEAIEAYLSRSLQKPEVSVDVSAYNSKVFYIVFDQALNGETVIRQPITGNETVLDALSQVNGLPGVADKRRITVVRPSPACSECDQILPVDWNAIVRKGRTETNWQLLPGDRIYVNSSRLLTIDNALARFIAPFERIVGATLLGTSVISTFQGLQTQAGTAALNGGTAIVTGVR
jgi:polysaccharide export outer membrane protein